MATPEEQRQKLENARSCLESLLLDYKTASLATVNEQGLPQASYVPVAPLGRQGFYFFVSELSEHTTNLNWMSDASLMLIEDEGKSEQLFARNRVTFEGAVEAVPRDSDAWPLAHSTYRERFGKFFDLLVGLKDFHMFFLRPNKIRLVVGFGAAYDVSGENWSQLELLTVK